MSAIERGGGAKIGIGQNCQQIVQKNCQQGRGGVVNPEEMVDVVYGKFS